MVPNELLAGIIMFFTIFIQFFMIVATTAFYGVSLNLIRECIIDRDFRTGIFMFLSLVTIITLHVYMAQHVVFDPYWENPVPLKFM